MSLSLALASLVLMNAARGMALLMSMGAVALGLLAYQRAGSNPALMDRTASTIAVILGLLVALPLLAVLMILLARGPLPETPARSPHPTGVKAVSVHTEEATPCSWRSPRRNGAAWNGVPVEIGAPGTTPGAPSRRGGVPPSDAPAWTGARWSSGCPRCNAAASTLEILCVPWYPLGYG